RHGALHAARHEDLRPVALRAVRDGLHLLRGCLAQRRLEERAAAADQAREQAGEQGHRRRRRAEDRRRGRRPADMTLTKDAPDSRVSATGPQSSIATTEVFAAPAAATGSHPQLNTKPLFKLMVEKK